MSTEKMTSNVETIEAEAEKILAALKPQKATLATRALHGLALARTGETEQAANIARSLVVADDAGPRGLYCAARLQATVGDAPRAMDLLRRCLENVPTSQQDGYRQHARECEDFAALSSTDAFAGALAVESKIPESKCSGGARCAGCPHRGKCGPERACPTGCGAGSRHRRRATR